MESEAHWRLVAQVQVLDAVIKGIISVLPDQQKAIESISIEIASVRSNASMLQAKHTGNDGAMRIRENVEAEAQRWLQELADFQAL